MINLNKYEIYLFSAGCIIFNANDSPCDMHMLSKVLNVPIVMHVNIDYYMHNAYVNYDSTLHKIPN